MNPLYQQIMNGAVPGIGAAPSFTPPSNPMGRMQAVLNAMRNPAAFVKQAFPDIPEGIQNDPNQILGYLQQSRGISNEQIQQLMSQIPMGGRR